MTETEGVAREQRTCFIRVFERHGQLAKRIAAREGVRIGAVVERALDLYLKAERKRRRRRSRK